MIVKNRLITMQNRILHEDRQVRMKGYEQESERVQRFRLSGEIGLPSLFFMALSLGLLMFMCGCSDPVLKHSLLSTLFDGVPALPTTEKLCEEEMGEKYKEFYEALAKEEASGQGGENSARQRKVVSKHRPFAEKKCEGCHDFQKTNLLVVEKNELCFVCHKDFVLERHVHGPVAVGDCLACHYPHDSKYAALLQESKDHICAKCHREERLAVAMHKEVISHQMNCIDCHDPHSSEAPYFLK